MTALHTGRVVLGWWRAAGAAKRMGCGHSQLQPRRARPHHIRVNRPAAAQGPHLAESLDGPDKQGILARPRHLRFHFSAVHHLAQ